MNTTHIEVHHDEDHYGAIISLVGKYPMESPKLTGKLKRIQL